MKQTGGDWDFSVYERIELGVVCRTLQESQAGHTGSRDEKLMKPENSEEGCYQHSKARYDVHDERVMKKMRGRGR